MTLFDWERFFTAIPKLLPYLAVTLQVVIVGVGLGAVFGFIFAILRLKKIPVIDQILSVYLSFMRGTPMLVQLMVLYYGLPLLLRATLGIDINGWEKLVFVDLCFVLNEAAFQGEIFRGAIEAVPYDQTEAAYSVGLTGMQTYIRVVIPQAIKIALPQYGVDVIGVFHNTQIAFMLGVMDLLGRAKTLGTASGHMLEVYIIVTIVYIVVSFLLRLLFRVLDQKLTFGRKAVSSV